jgi:hypothetical protein
MHPCQGFWSYGRSVGRPKLPKKGAQFKGTLSAGCLFEYQIFPKLNFSVIKAKGVDWRMNPTWQVALYYHSDMILIPDLWLRWTFPAVRPSTRSHSARSQVVSLSRPALARAAESSLQQEPYSLPRKDGRVRACVVAMDPADVSVSSVSCASTWSAIDERQLPVEALRTDIMNKARTRGFTLLNHVKDLTPEIARLWEEGLLLHPRRLFDIVLFKNTPKADGSIDPGDESKLACQLGDEIDPSLALLKILVGLLLPPGYRIGSVEDVLCGRRSLEAYVIWDLGSPSDQTIHVDSAPEAAPGQFPQDPHVMLHDGNLGLYQSSELPPCTLWLSQRGPDDPPVSVVIFAASNHPVLAAFTFQHTEYAEGLKRSGASEEEYSGYYMAAVARHLKNKFPELAGHPLQGRLVTPDHDGGLLLHGLCIHCGTGDAGYRLVAAADPPGWVRHPTTTACFVLDSLSLASMVDSVMLQLPIRRLSGKRVA